MNKLKFKVEGAQSFLKEGEMELLEPFISTADKLLKTKKGPGNEFLGWADLPQKYDKVEFKAIKQAAEDIRSNSEVLIVIGIGGSYLGAKAAIDFLSHSFYNNLPKNKRKGPEIYFAGTNISSTYHKDLMEVVGDRDFAINMISKSGTTTEPAIAFRFFKKKLEDKYGKKEAKNRIFATTDKKKGALKTLAKKEGYQTFVVPDDVGGRFSVLTAVGLLPIACAGVDIDELMSGAKEAMKDSKKALKDNTCYQYVAARNALHRQGKDIEMLVNYEPRCTNIAEWWKQLYGESEGKDGKGIFPASANFTCDLHSMGQYIQDGKRHLFETILTIQKPQKNLKIEKDKLNLDGLNYLAGKSMDYVNKKAKEGTLMAHVDGGVPNLEIVIPAATPFHLGYLFYFFEKACAVSGYLLGVNPFDQPGVEAYKKNMFKLLGKPGVK